mgnify:CR=1 FL=1
MRAIPLAQIPNQSFTLRLDGQRMVLRVKEARGLMVLDFEREGVTLLSGSPIIAGEALIPYRYLESGNFILLTVADELPDWQQFGLSQTLVYLSAAEIFAAFRMSVGDIPTAPAGADYLVTDDGDYITTDDGELIEAE